MKPNLFTVLAVCAAMAIPTAQAQDGDAKAGKALYTLCAGCHGADGMGMEATDGPRLQGQFGWYLVRQLKNFKSGTRGSDSQDILGATMRAMAGTLTTDQAIRDVVAYIETLESP